MNSVAPPNLQLAILTREGFADVDIEVADIPKLLMDLTKGVAFELTVYPVDQMKQFPRIHVDWHQSYGFVVMAFENEQSIGFYPIVGTSAGPPEIPIELGGQALENWPRELFVPHDIATRVVKTFIQTGRQDESVKWVANNAFKRQVLWETQAQRIAWERKQRRRSPAG